MNFEVSKDWCHSQCGFALPSWILILKPSIPFFYKLPSSWCCHSNRKEIKTEGENACHINMRIQAQIPRYHVKAKWVWWSTSISNSQEAGKNSRRKLTSWISQKFQWHNQNIHSGLCKCACIRTHKHMPPYIFQMHTHICAECGGTHCEHISWEVGSNRISNSRNSVT